MKRNLSILMSLFFIFSYCKNSEKQPQEAFEIPSELRSTVMVLDDFLKNYDQPSQSFIVKGKQAQQLMGANGTLLFINSEDVETLDGKSVGATIEVELKEILSIPEFIINQLQTLSNEKLLVSDGMYYINMTSKGEQLKLKEGKTVKVQLSNNRINDTLNAESLNNAVAGMALFYGRQQGGELATPTYKINLSDSIKIANIYVILKDKSLIKSQSFFLKNEITNEPIGEIPVNEPIKFFAVAYQNDKIYAFQTDFKKVLKNKEETLDLKPISQSAFEEMMRNLAK